MIKNIIKSIKTFFLGFFTAIITIAVAFVYNFFKKKSGGKNERKKNKNIVAPYIRQKHKEDSPTKQRQLRQRDKHYNR